MRKQLIVAILILWGLLLCGCVEGAPESLDEPDPTPHSSKETEDSVEISQGNIGKRLVVLDPGHGGDDPGAIGVLSNGQKIFEKDVNLSIALRLRDKLEAAGVDVMMIRETDVYIDHRQRGEIADKAGGSLFISIHNNGSDVSSVHGTEVWYNEKVDEFGSTLVQVYGVSSKALARRIQVELCEALGTRDRGIRKGIDLAVLIRTRMPSVAVEGGYMSHSGDLKIITSESFDEDYANAVFRAVMATLDEGWEDGDKQKETRNATQEK